MPYACRLIIRSFHQHLPPSNSNIGAFRTESVEQQRHLTALVPSGPLAFLMHLLNAIVAFVGFTSLLDNARADDPVKIRHFLQALSYDEFRDLEMHLRNPFATKGALLAKVEQLSQRLPKKIRVSFFAINRKMLPIKSEILWCPHWLQLGP